MSTTAGELRSAAKSHNLAQYYLAEGRLNEAEPLLWSALSIRERLLGALDPNVLNTLTCLANALGGQCKYEAAESVHKVILLIKEKVLGSNHVDLSAECSNLASILDAQRKYSEAESYYRRALEITENNFVSDHQNLAGCLVNLATACTAQQKWSEARNHYERAVAIHESHLGPDHPRTVDGLERLAAIVKVQTDADIPSLSRQLQTLQQKALEQHRNGCYAQAGALYKKLIDMDLQDSIVESAAEMEAISTLVAELLVLQEEQQKVTAAILEKFAAMRCADPVANDGSSISVPRELEDLKWLEEHHELLHQFASDETSEPISLMQLRQVLERSSTTTGESILLGLRQCLNVQPEKFMERAVEVRR